MKKMIEDTNNKNQKLDNAIPTCSIKTMHECIVSSQCTDIIFDFSGVVIDVTSDFTQEIFGEAFNHLKELFLHMLHITGEEKKYFYKELPLPEIVHNWSRGLVSSAETKKYVHTLVKENTHDKKIAQKMLWCVEYIFTPSLFARYTLKLNQKVADIIHVLATSENSKNKLYLFSNLEGAILDELKKFHPSVFKYLTKTVSAPTDLGASKPDPESYTRMLKKFGLKAETCIFIDDTEANCKAALECGIATIQLVDKR